MKKSHLLGIVLVLSCFLSTSLHAQKAIEKLSRNYYVAGPQTEEVQFIEATPKCQNYCWAACAQILLNYHGLSLSQEQIIERIHNGKPCEIGDGKKMIKALNGWSPPSVEKVSKIHASYGNLNTSDLVEHLSNGWPIIVGLDSRSLSRQVYVLSAVYFSMDHWDHPKIDEVLLRNPWPLSPSEEYMRWDLFKTKNPTFFDVWVD